MQSIPTIKELTSELLLWSQTKIQHYQLEQPATTQGNESIHISSLPPIAVVILAPSHSPTTSPKRSLPSNQPDHETLLLKYHKYQCKPNAGRIPSSVREWREANGGTHAVMASILIKKDGTKEDVQTAVDEAVKTV